MARFLNRSEPHRGEHKPSVRRGASGQRRLGANGQDPGRGRQQAGHVLFGPRPGHAIRMAAREVGRIFTVRKKHVRRRVNQGRVCLSAADGGGRARGTGMDERRRHGGTTMLRQNFTWTTTLSLAAALTLGTWVMAEHLQQSRVDTRQARTGQTMLMLEFQRLHDRGEVLVLDVRDRISYEGGRIAGAVFATVDDLETDPRTIADIKTLAKGRLVVAYCSCPTEASSLRAVRILDAHGVYASALVGGFPRWVAAGGRTEHGPPKD